MKIFVGADHRGFSLKKTVIKILEQRHYTVVDVGTHQNQKPCDYPQISFQVATSVRRNKNACGILICMTGIGHSIAANRVSGVRAALCYTKKAAYFSRAHNNANILVVGSKFVSQKELFMILDTWLKTSFEGGRHRRRVKKIEQLSQKHCCAHTRREEKHA